MAKSVVTFGEIMLRLSPPGFQRFIQAQEDIVDIRQDADNYVLDTLRGLEMEMDRALSQIRNGIYLLQQEKGEKQTESE